MTKQMSELVARQTEIEKQIAEIKIKQDKLRKEKQEIDRLIRGINRTSSLIDNVEIKYVKNGSRCYYALRVKKYEYYRGATLTVGNTRQELIERIKVLINTLNELIKREEGEE